jgi:Family of unknown function (DUF5670)
LPSGDTEGDGELLANNMHSAGWRGVHMLLLVVLLLVLWFLGVLTKATLGGLLHILLVVAIVIGLVNFIRSRV